MKKYQISICDDKIEKIDVIKETEKTVWIKIIGFNGEPREDKQLKGRSWMPIFDTFNEAKEYIIKKATNEIESLNYSVKKAEEKLSKINELKE